MLITLAILGGFIVLSFITTLGVYAYGRLAKRPTGGESFVLPVGDTTALDGMLGPLTQAHPGKTGLLLLEDNLHAFAARALSVRAAGRSLDLLYYYWKDDLTGTLLAAEVLRAADRGVRVRLLLDDINLGGRDGRYLAMGRHPNIEVRVFNPCWNRAAGLRRGFEILLRGFSSTRRMHNKAWIADGRLAIVGGRNIGDAYFDASETMNFSDMDLAVCGPAVAEAETIFDSYWNSRCVFPLDFLSGSDRGDLQALRAATDEAERSAQSGPYLRQIADRPLQHLLSGGAPIHWVEQAKIISDPPAKSDGRAENRWLHKVIVPMVLSATKRLDISSPYFIPGELGVAQLLALVRQGVDVTILTNSLAATDVAAVHGAYARYRKALADGGVGLYELKPDASRRWMSLFGSSGASLHTKAFVVDDDRGFVGSFNFDPRSVSLNTEMGVVFESKALAEEIRRVLKHQTAPAASYRIEVDSGRLAWKDANGTHRSLRGEPGAGLWRRIVAAAIGVLPIESQL